MHGDPSYVPGAGDVVHEVYDTSYILYNITQENHIFHDGYVEREVIALSDGIYVLTFGEGENSSAFYKDLNEITAEPAFNSVDEALRDSVISVDEGWFSWF
jgi:hypothetical protein